MTRVRRKSLRRELTVKLIVLQSLTLIILAVASQFADFVGNGDRSAELLDPTYSRAIAAAVSRGPDGSLLVAQDKLAELRAEAPDLWFVVADAEGRRLAAGVVPEVHTALSQHLDSVDFADIRDKRPGSPGAASLRVENADAGRLHVLYGNAPLLGIGLAFVDFFSTFVGPVLLLVLMGLAVVMLITTPLIVRSATKGIVAAVQSAEGIDIEQRGTRLPTAQVPAEVAALVVAINAALERLDEGYERQQMFLADAAHELKTPIAILQSRIELAPDDRARARLLLDVGRLSNMAETLLDMQRLKHRGLSGQSADIVSVFAQVAADLAPLAISAGYELSFESEVRHAVVNGDANAIERALTNLVQNAIAHGANRGNIAIRVRSDHRVDVCDDGPGIPSEQRDLIFQPFHRLKPQDRGSGLGLSLVREIMHRHGGSVSVRASDSGGACFSLRFPQPA
jgi:two-component system OmpR family sensor kinase